MVEHKNAGQVLGATWHVISPTQEFSEADKFVESIGTDLYAPDDYPRMFNVFRLGV